MRHRVPAAALSLLLLLALLCNASAQQQAKPANASVQAFKRIKSCAPVNVLVSPSNASSATDSNGASKASIEITAEDAVVKALDVQVGCGPGTHAGLLCPAQCALRLPWCQRMHCSAPYALSPTPTLPSTPSTAPSPGVDSTSGRWCTSNHVLLCARCG